MKTTFILVFLLVGCLTDPTTEHSIFSFRQPPICESVDHPTEPIDILHSPPPAFTYVDPIERRLRSCVDESSCGDFMTCESRRCMGLFGSWCNADDECRHDLQCFNLHCTIPERESSEFQPVLGFAANEENAIDDAEDDEDESPDHNEQNTRSAGDSCNRQDDCPAETQCLNELCAYPLMHECQFGRECGARARCERSPACEEDLCEMNVCLGADGTPCNQHASNSDCATSLACVPEGDGHICRIPQRGGECDDVYDCVIDMFCSEGVCKNEAEHEWCSALRPCADGLGCKPINAYCAPPENATNRCTSGCEPTETTTCLAEHDRCPSLDENGVFQCRDATWEDTSQQGEYISLSVADTWDDGEGDDWPHGPSGNLYYGFAACHIIDNVRHLPDNIMEIVPVWRPLRGPEHTGQDGYGAKCEWNDLNTVRYNPSRCALYRWNEVDDRGCVVLVIYESDSCGGCSHNVGDFGRSCRCKIGPLEIGTRRFHDIMAAVRIQKNETSADCDRIYHGYSYEGYTQAAPLVYRCDPNEHACTPSMKLHLRTIAH